jgi:hypothetical protein
VGQHHALGLPVVPEVKMSDATLSLLIDTGGAAAAAAAR